jgi:hypothetical protein
MKAGDAEVGERVHPEGPLEAVGDNGITATTR